MEVPLILASASPRRRKILESMGLTFDVVVPLVEEIHETSDPTGTVQENAARKCAWARDQHPGVAVIAADTVVVFDGECIGKPKSLVDAVAMLRRFSATSQTVFTGVAMATAGGDVTSRVDRSVVHFRELTDAAIEKYVQLVDPLDKAGGYDIDQHGDLIIRGYEGSWTNIMGLPQRIVEDWLPCR
jgi:septum formation protein